MLHTRADEPSSVINSGTAETDSRFGSEHNSKINAYANSPWNDANTAYLKAQWSLGHSAREIGLHIGVTRSAVIGRAHRLGVQRKVDYTFWTAAQVEQLVLLWNQKISAPQIAAQLCREFDGKRVCKSTVLNKARSLGLFRRPQTRDRRSAPSRRARKVVPFATIIDTDIPVEQRKALVDLERGDCKWPIGDPGTPEFFFCGGKAHKGGPYCPAHHHRAHGYAPTGKKFGGFRF